jgi:hypothetical protein
MKSSEDMDQIYFPFFADMRKGDKMRVPNTWPKRKKPMTHSQKEKEWRKVVRNARRAK